MSEDQPQEPKKNQRSATKMELQQHSRAGNATDCKNNSHGRAIILFIETWQNEWVSGFDSLHMCVNVICNVGCSTKDSAHSNLR